MSDARTTIDPVQAAARWEAYARDMAARMAKLAEAHQASNDSATAWKLEAETARGELATVERALGVCRDRTERLQAALAALVPPPSIPQDPIVVVPPPDPPTRPEPPAPPPVVDPPPRQDPPSGEWYEVAPDLSGMPFSSELPAFPRYHIPTEVECDWIIEDGVATSTRGLGTLQGPAYMIAPAYRASVAAGHELPIRFGVKGNGGTAIFGAGWSQPKYYNTRSVFVENADGTFANMRAEIVGLTPDAEVQVGWGDKWGFTRHLGLYNIGLRGPSDSFVIRAGPIGDLYIDGCWWLPYKDENGGVNVPKSGMHLDSWTQLVVRRLQWRGETPGSPGIKLGEHSLYLKSPAGPTWLIENNLFGGNRTCFQMRPTKGEDPEPAGPVMVAYNYADGLDYKGDPCGYGWNHGWDAASSDGGSGLSLWATPNSTNYVFRNRIEDARYGCVMVGGQPPVRNFLNENGYPHRTTWLWDNTFSNAQVGRPSGIPRRSAAKLTAIEQVFVGANSFPLGGGITIDNKWGIETHGIRCGAVRLHTDTASTVINSWWPEGDEEWTLEKKKAHTVDLYSLHPI